MTTFKLPFVVDKPDRYCHFCGFTIKAEWKSCKNQDCRAEKKPQPQIPSWNLCNGCKIGWLQATDHFCVLCRFRTELGTKWVKEKAELNKAIRRMKFELNSKYGAGAASTGGAVAPHGPAAQALPAAPAVAPAQALPPAPGVAPAQCIAAAPGVPAVAHAAPIINRGGFQLDEDELMLLAAD